ncbi:hypothetical protein EHI8A_155800 [Entamoeba histolytica HM-1:IMSS-B]|uniref:Ras-GEF domain-containing protein n=4 Tax=Entamoeba histolytica TaxID=5759 RepID=C4M724_ENTH1|nr:hypothetical protein EHI_183450 [Entamoeba histolytica HM-1:IMSS]EAL48945.1 hypothetical protein EHI_183450 [Entamoeba histolytica HM-1:IMSS]EMH74792.1 hypothetical protein EHI8A_155800 [Entamoeba histolytica HM-1:IMSS-B]ENY66037.1 hypothetical protein EHI7A_008270 [Entamoeba histolytica HM-1:IMSS-A]GAT97316.1 hypothetical protein CL6EHI_183450 [Entamoeba histolytica]|eukprot:XP_654331.1 hypothetical protein EHI_183450 [Entamoeba histolytica HM-1:IMSS]
MFQHKRKSSTPTEGIGVMPIQNSSKDKLSLSLSLFGELQDKSKDEIYFKDNKSDEQYITFLKQIQNTNEIQFVKIANHLIEKNMFLIEGKFNCCWKVTVKDIRIIVWQMKEFKRKILSIMCKCINDEELDEVNEKLPVFQRCCFGHGSKTNNYNFIKEIIYNYNSIFDIQGDPLLNNQFSIEEVSKMKILEYMVDPFAPKDFIVDAMYSLYLFSSVDEVCTFIAGAHTDLLFALSEQNEIEYKLLQEQVVFISRLLFSIYSPSMQNKTTLKCLLNPTYPTDFRKFIENIYQGITTNYLRFSKSFNIIGDFKERNRFNQIYKIKLGKSLDLSKLNKKIKKSVDYLQEIKTFNKIVLVNLEPFFIAEQIALFDHKCFNLVEVKELVYYEHKSSFKRYQQTMEHFSQNIEQLIETESDIDFFISVFHGLFFYNEFNGAYLIYNILSNKKKSNPLLFNKIKKISYSLYSKLEIFFKEINGHELFWIYYCSLPLFTSKVPVVDFWLDRIRSDDVLTLDFGERLNAEKIKKISIDVQLWIEAKETKFIFDEIDIVMKYFNNLAYL